MSVCFTFFPSPPSHYNRYDFYSEKHSSTFKHIIFSACIPIDTIQGRTSLIPKWYEWVMLSELLKFSNIKFSIIFDHFSLVLWTTIDRIDNSWWADQCWHAEVSWSPANFGSFANNLLFRPIIVFFGAVAVGIHLTLFALPSSYTNILLYIRSKKKIYFIIIKLFLKFRNQFLAWSFLFGMVQILDFLKFHHMFGPWAIIISR